MNWKVYLQRFRNPGTVLGIVGSVGLLLVQFGIDIDLEWLDNTAKIVCYICIALGFMNNPDTKGIDLPGVGKKQ